jgi:aminoglycoside phosphotransferase family enzyme/predicted kinase
MIDDPLVRDLLAPGNLPDGPVEFVSTHASFVFLTPREVYKVKRAKDYGFFDYTTLEARRHFCEEELRLNRRTAPDVYRGVVPVYRDDAGHSLTRPGLVVDWAVHMERLPEDRSALSLARAGRLGHDDVERIARRVAAFYASLPAAADLPESLRANIRENFDQVRPYVGRFVEARLLDETREAQEGWLAAQQARLARRVPRDGHGDLRLEHVYLMPQEVLIIDCIEFLDRFRIADPALDAAFLAMDLRANGRPDLAEHFFGRFAYESDDYDFLPLADGYVSYRAWVRGKVACFVSDDPQADRATASRKAAEAARFFELARDALRPREGPPRLIAVGGIVGTGKTTVAEALGRRLAAPVVSADATRKFLAGLPHDAPGPERIYAREFTERVQEELLRRAGLALESGRSAIVDTTFAARELRERTRRFATGRGARLFFVECRAPEEVARERLRRRAGGVSDAREELYPVFRKGFEPVDELPEGEHLPVDTTQPLDRIVEWITERVA